MITPSADKEVIQAILSTDPFIERMGFKAENINTTRASNDVFNANSPDFCINISTGEPEGGSTWLVKNATYKVVVSGKRSKSSRIDEVSEQVIALLDERDIGRGHILYLLDPPLELSSDPSIYIVETTFLCQSTAFNVVRR